MCRRTLFSFVAFLLAAGALSVIPVYGPMGVVTRLLNYEQTSVPENVLWTTPVNAFSIGIEPPSQAFTFLRAENGSRGRVNPWGTNTTIHAYLKNSGDKVLYWSNDPRAWWISFTSETFRQPTPYPGSILYQMATSPIPLKAGEVVKLKIPIGKAFVVWPHLKEGVYHVRVNYDSTELPKRAVGNIGKFLHAFDVPGFWVGTLQTPVAEVTVKHVSAATGSK